MVSHNNIMRLLKVKAYSKNGNVQYKYIINIPERLVNQLGWEAGSELEGFVSNNSLCIKFVSEPILQKRSIEQKMSYEEFRDKIKEVL